MTDDDDTEYSDEVRAEVSRTAQMAWDLIKWRLDDQPHLMFCAAVQILAVVIKNADDSDSADLVDLAAKMMLDVLPTMKESE